MATFPLITANDDQFPAVWHTGPIDVDGNTQPITSNIYDPFRSDVILQTSVTTAELIDVSPLANALSKAGSGGGPAYTAADPLFGGPVYDLSNGTHRLLVSDAFISSLFGNEEWTVELQLKGVSIGSNPYFMSLSTPDFGEWSVGTTISFSLGVNGLTYTATGAAPNLLTQFNHIVLQRNNTADSGFAFFEIGINGVRVAVSGLFTKTLSMSLGAGATTLLGYSFGSALVKANEIRFVKNQRVYNMSTDYATPLAYTPQSAPHPVGP